MVISIIYLIKKIIATTKTVDYGDEKITEFTQYKKPGIIFFDLLYFIIGIIVLVPFVFLSVGGYFGIIINVVILLFAFAVYSVIKSPGDIVVFNNGLKKKNLRL